MKVNKFRLRRSEPAQPTHPFAAEAPASAVLSRPSRKGAPKASKIMSGWRLGLTSWWDFRSNWKRYIIIVGIVTVPGNLLALNSDLSQNQLFTATTSFAAFVMNVALLWAITRRQQAGVMPTVAESYYDGQIALIRYLLVSVALVCMLITFALGLVLYAAGQIMPGTSASAFSPELLLLAAVWLVLSIPSFYFLVRFGLAPFAAVADGFRPVAALRVSWRVTKRRFWATAGRFAVLGLLIIAISIPITVISILMSVLHAGVLATAFFEITTSMAVLPFMDLYMMRLYRTLEAATLGRRVQGRAVDAASTDSTRNASITE